MSTPNQIMPTDQDGHTQLTPQAIASMRPGHELDRYVHTLVLGLPVNGRRSFPRYSTNPAGAMQVLSAVPIEVGRYAAHDIDRTDERPYYGRFTAGPITDPKVVLLRAPTPELALCKTALLYRSVVGRVVVANIRSQRTRSTVTDNLNPPAPTSDARPGSL